MAGEQRAATIDEYCRRGFDAGRLPPAPVLPLEDEPHLEDWHRYIREGADAPFAFLQQRLPQLSIPIRAGVSSTDAYAAVARRGEPFDERRFGGSLALERPACCRLFIHRHPAGALPVLCSAERADFERLVRALARRSEPAAIHPAVNAQKVAGFINWDRVGRLRAAWQGSAAAWPAELQRLAAEEPWRIKDRFIVIGVAPYSGVPPERLELPLTLDEWIDRSTAIRLEHEFTHYATKRLFGEMRVHLLDEIIADVMGFTSAFGSFRARWAVACYGLDGGSGVRKDGRLHAYRGELSDGDFQSLCGVAVRALAALERICDRFYSAEARARFLLALTCSTLDDFAASEAESRFSMAWEQAGRLTGVGAGRAPAASLPAARVC